MVTTTCFRPICAVAYATFSGSFGSSGSGLPVATLQKLQARVQMPPRIMKVACFWLQHSPMFGQPASSQTVCSFSVAHDLLGLVVAGAGRRLDPDPVRLARAGRCPAGPPFQDGGGGFPRLLARKSISVGTTST